MEIWRVARRLRHAYRHADRRSHRATPDEFFGLESLQKIEPSERFGNLLIFRGSFNLPIAHANRFYWRAWIVCTIPNVVLRRRSFCSNARPDLNPNFYPAWIELGNLHAQR